MLFPLLLTIIYLPIALLILWCKQSDHRPLRRAERRMLIVLGILLLLSLPLYLDFVPDGGQLAWAAREFEQVGLPGADRLVPLAEHMRTTVYTVFSGDQELGIAAFTRLPGLPHGIGEFVREAPYGEPFAFQSQWYFLRDQLFGLEGNRLWNTPQGFHISNLILGAYLLLYAGNTLSDTWKEHKKT